MYFAKNIEKLSQVLQKNVKNTLKMLFLTQGNGVNLLYLTFFFFLILKAFYSIKIHVHIYVSLKIIRCHTCYCFSNNNKILNYLRSQFSPQALFTQLLGVLCGRKYIWEYSEPVSLFFVRILGMTYQ